MAAAAPPFVEDELRVCLGPGLTSVQDTDDPCGKDPDCTRKSTTTVKLHCRATLHGDTLVIDRNPAKINIDGDTQSGPPKGACEALPWTGSHALTF